MTPQSQSQIQSEALEPRFTIEDSTFAAVRGLVGNLFYLWQTAPGSDEEVQLTMTRESALLLAQEIMRRLSTPDAAPVGLRDTWTCFHCGDTFTDRQAARLHFGRDERSEDAMTPDREGGRI